MNKQILLLTGPPGAGKGTQAGLMAERLGWRTFSVGQLLRDTAEPEVRARIDSGDLLPSEYVVGLVVKEISKAPSSIVVDGFPRTLAQANEFGRLMEIEGEPGFTVVLIDVDQEASWRRVSGRGRADDERTSWEHRWEEYRTKTIPALESYRASGSLVEVDGNGSIESVYEEISSSLVLGG